MFTQLVAFGMAMAATYYLSNGNLLIPSFIHGLFDAAGFLTIAVSLNFGAILRLQLFYVGLAFLGAVIIQWLWKRSRPTEHVYQDTIDIQ